MDTIKLVATDVANTLSVIESIDAERIVKKDLIEKNVTFPETSKDKLAVIHAYAKAIGMEVKSELLTNKVKDYAFIWRPWQDKKQAQIWIFNNSNLWRLEVTWSNKYIKLWYANTSSETWFSRFETTQG